MSNLKPVIIVGGGLAGLTLGIGLRHRGVPVTIREAGVCQRHRVCGEFISGRGQDTLARLGLSGMLDEAGAVRARTVAFFTASRSTAPRPLPAAGICLSRQVLDAVLAARFRELGGELIENERVIADFGEGIVRATGRRAAPAASGTRWFGLKIHARQVELTADLEMHVSPQGYVGLCRINGGEVNVCGLFRKGSSGSADATNRRVLLRGQPGSPLHQRLAKGEFADQSWCAVAGISLHPQHAAARPELSVGDAITMIPPVTGNGMSMAFESAELAIAPLTQWSMGERSWQAACDTIARACDAAFARRLAWARWLQSAVLIPALQNPLVALASRSDWWWRAAFYHTR